LFVNHQLKNSRLDDAHFPSTWIIEWQSDRERFRDTRSKALEENCVLSQPTHLFLSGARASQFLIMSRLSIIFLKKNSSKPPYI
jgi:hypothetical protein